MRSSLVSEWFGEAFGQLHPLLQELHLAGGTLAGEVRVRFGDGLAGIVGRRIARKLGVPTTAGPQRLTVDISHVSGVLEWSRRFESGERMTSKFQPHGAHPNGYWLEKTGALRLDLGVDVRDGGWHWRPLATYLGPVRVPNRLLPVTTAYKTIVGDKYEFSVSVSWKPLGFLFSYAGLLDYRGPAARPRVHGSC